jgi:hypothetical protein
MVGSIRFDSIVALRIGIGSGSILKAKDLVGYMKRCLDVAAVLLEATLTKSWSGRITRGR